MAKDRKAREMGGLTLAAFGVIICSIVDVMREAGVPNNVGHAFVDRLEIGFTEVLWGDALSSMYELIDIIRTKMPSND